MRRLYKTGWMDGCVCNCVYACGVRQSALLCNALRATKVDVHSVTLVFHQLCRAQLHSTATDRSAALD
eukprot:364857-Chlamydomonas_euryale.AAC.2